MGCLIILSAWALAIWLRIIPHFSFHRFLSSVRIIIWVDFLIASRSCHTLILWILPTSFERTRRLTSILLIAKEKVKKIKILEWNTYKNCLLLPPFGVLIFRYGFFESPKELTTYYALTDRLALLNLSLPMTLVYSVFHPAFYLRSFDPL